MTPAITWTTVLLIIVAGFVHRLYWRVRLQKIEDVQRVREQFASDRREAIRLLSENQLKPASEGFQMLYLTSSLLVRRANNYPHYAKQAMHRLAQSEFHLHSPRMRRIQTEMEEWTPEVREAWISFAKHVEEMIERHVVLVRIFLWLDSRGLAFVVRPMARMAVHVLERLASKRPSLGDTIDVARTGRAAASWARGDPFSDGRSEGKAAA